MYGYDPIFLEKRKLNEWLQESEDNILVIFDKTSLNFSASPNSPMKNNSQDKIYCLKKQYLFNPEIKDIFVKCFIENEQLMVKQTYSTKATYNNIGYYINKNVLIDIKSLKPSLHKERIFKVVINSEEEDKYGDNMYISKETLELSKIGLFKIKKLNVADKKITNKNIPYKEDVYFEKLLSKALFDYSYKWDGPINSYLRFGLTYFQSPIFLKTYKVYGDTKKDALFAILAKIEDLDRAFLEAAPRHERPFRTYYRGMKEPFTNLINVGDSVTIPNFISITDNYGVALNFSDIKKTQCCIYEINIANGVPYINMINTSKYKAEQETLLPRNLKFTITSKHTTATIQKYFVSVSLQNNDQFKIPSGCSKFYLGKLIRVKSSYLDLATKPKKDVAILKNKKTTNSKRERCSNGTRKNKITGNCEPIITTNYVIKERNPVKQKTKSKRCPNGTRKNKITGLCEKINEV
jgi:hypothetical protein